MNFEHVIAIYEKIKTRLPKTYNYPKLAFFEDQESMIKVFDCEVSSKETLYALYFDGIIAFNASVINIKEVDIARVILHEIYHAYAERKYGGDSLNFINEVAADQFASRWLKKINLENTNSRFLGWTSGDIDYLKENYFDTSKDDIVSILGRNWSAIKQKANSMGLKRNRKAMNEP